MDFSKKSHYILNNGEYLPTKGIGTWRSDPSKLPEIIKKAIEIGYCHIDTGSLYKNEEIIGETLQKIFYEGKIKRKDIFITSKIWNDQKEHVEESLKTSLSKLKLEYLDLYLIHWPMGYYNEKNDLILTPLHKVWSEMENCVRKGLCKSIGISNFNVQLILDLLSYAKIKPVVNQIEFHPYLSQKNLIDFCQKFNIQIVGYSPFCRLRKDILNENIIVDLAKKYNKTNSQIILNWCLMKKTAVIPKSDNFERLENNFFCDNFELEKNDIEKIDELNKNERINERIVKEDFKIPLFD